ncbi:hypothetical protein Taro_008728 [Colocasia esculenta]|uniref:Uncharacterized protein n=1 Tax=Colocasia esculenta TaxID=4460 RepID=A0A843U2M2_COLES|nr:hypothetical protein [Colocasia esculenta]
MGLATNARWTGTRIGMGLFRDLRTFLQVNNNIYLNDVQVNKILYVSIHFTPV